MILLIIVKCDAVICAMSHPAVQRMFVALQMLLLSICTMVNCTRVDKLQLGGMEGAPTPQDHEPAGGKNQYLLVYAYCADCLSRIAFRFYIICMLCTTGWLNSLIPLEASSRNITVLFCGITTVVNS